MWINYTREYLWTIHQFCFKKMNNLYLSHQVSSGNGFQILLETLI